MMIDGEDNTDIDMDMELDPYLLFKNSIRSPLTLVKYQARLNAFFDFICIPNGPINERCNIFIKNCQQNSKYPLHHVFRFVLSKKEQMQSKKIVVSTINNYLKPIKKLCKLNDIHVKWEKITSGLPKEIKYAEDRAPLLEEIQKLIEYPDRRLKAIVIIMTSSGIRLAVWDDLKLKHIKPKKDKDGKIIAAKIIVYPGTEEEYYSFITPEAFNFLTEWIDFRKKSGENITEESCLMRNLWDVTTPSGGPRVLVTVPKKLKHTGIKSLIERSLRAQGIRTD